MREFLQIWAGLLLVVILFAAWFGLLVGLVELALIPAQPWRGIAVALACTLWFTGSLATAMRQ